jgi:palmitoyl transferase
MLRLLFALAALALTSVATAAEDGKPGFLDRISTELSETWRGGNTEYFATFRTWHLPWAYTDEQAGQYQNWPPGLGVGRGRFDEKGNWHGVYFLGFQDSHFKPEWNVGYGWKAYWNVFGGLKAGLGYTAGLTARSDIGHYVPIPMLLPIASLDYDKLSLEGAFVPGGKGNGNVMLLWLKWRSDSKSLFGWTP